jgi:hypothetical protein
MRDFLKFLCIAALQCALFYAVFWLWRTIAPTVGLIGLTAWRAGVIG